MAISSDRLPEQGETMQGYDFTESLGGKGCNQALASARLGVETTMIGAVGVDFQGTRALKRIRAGRVKTDYIVQTDKAHTGTAIIVRVAKDNRIILNQGANGVLSEAQVEAGLAEAQVDDFLLTQFEIPIDIVLAGLARAKTHGMVTVVNPTPAVNVDDALLGQTDIIVLNQVESETLTGIYPETQVDAEKIAAWFGGKGIKLIVLTLGSGGSFCLSEEETIFTPAYDVDVVDTTGAGDAFIGTMLYGLSQGMKLNACLQYAAAAGALACTKEGAQAALPTLRELQAFMHERGE
jgi:ribokinase